VEPGPAGVCVSDWGAIECQCTWSDEYCPLASERGCSTTRSRRCCTTTPTHPQSSARARGWLAAVGEWASAALRRRWRPCGTPIPRCCRRRPRWGPTAAQSWGPPSTSAATGGSPGRRPPARHTARTSCRCCRCARTVAGKSPERRRQPRGRPNVATPPATFARRGGTMQTCAGSQRRPARCGTTTCSRWRAQGRHELIGRINRGGEWCMQRASCADQQAPGGRRQSEQLAARAPAKSWLPRHRPRLRVLVNNYTTACTPTHVQLKGCGSEVAARPPTERMFRWALQSRGRVVRGHHWRAATREAAPCRRQRGCRRCTT